MNKAVVFGTVLALASGCKASVSANANVNTGGEAETAEPGFDPAMSSAEPEAPPSTGETPLYGARHDLAFRGPATTRCECLSVALGQARDPVFEWATEVPNTDPDTQFTVAISTEQNCAKAAPDSLGASYWGYQISGQDVVVVLENAVPGRPITTGAIIPKPVGEGQVYLRPLHDKVPYGRGLDGAPRCKLGNPGGVRSAPATTPQGGPLRIGEDEAPSP